ncbi:DUF6745 domain-containing protein [Deinococcus sp. QL22]|uniref:DUF6745 domain-containing protein n=1 Tax=Deinococcus sp. QL22 TaxID=2939437 RepID=UPI0020178C89|nr:hypothetical protein [Deinococcus sp. QL22]UQN05547.1 hypothetical protein M1R55_11770 [Deinococcus sp. QL22]
MFRVQSGGRVIARPQKPEREPEAPTVAPAKASAALPQPVPLDTSQSGPRVPVRYPSLPPIAPATPQTATPRTVTPDEARELLRRGPVPAALTVSGPLNLSGAAWLRALPDWLRCTVLTVDDCPNLSALPTDLHAERLSARRTLALHEIDGRLGVRDSINLNGSGVRVLSADLRATRLSLAGCRDLRVLGGGVSVAHLDVSGCAALAALHPDAHITQTLELAGSGLTALPPSIRAGLRWSGVPVDARFAFAPDTLTGHEVLNTRNAQRRRVLLDRIGLDRFLQDVGGLILHRDRDAGGERQLVHVPFDNDEPLVAVLVRCPSTGGRYALRVPPHIRTCAAAVAWTAGLEPDDYQPVRET